MSRTVYHRAYYWRRLSERRASARASRRRARLVAALVKIVSEAVTEARNEKPPIGKHDGGLTRLSGSLTLELRSKRDGSLTDCSSLVNHPTTPRSSGTLVGETTHRATLNLNRGSQPLGARRIVGKRKWQPEQSGEK